MSSDKVRIKFADYSPFDGAGHVKVDVTAMYYRAWPGALPYQHAPADQMHWWEGDGEGGDYPPGWYSTAKLGGMGVPHGTRLTLARALGL